MPSSLQPQSPLARFFLATGLLGATAAAALGFAVLKLGRGGPVDMAIALAAALLLCAQGVPIAGLLAWARLRNQDSRLALGSGSPWLFALGGSAVILVGLFVMPTLAVLAGLLGSTVFVSHRLAGGSRPWIIAWTMASAFVLFADVAAAGLAVWWFR